MKKVPDLRLYLVTDRRLCLGCPFEKMIEAALRGGVTAVQLREKECSTREFVMTAKRVQEVLKSFHVPLIINDRVDVALAVGAEGVHLGQMDMPYREARKLMGPKAIIGLSVETLEQALEVEDWDVDYLGVSPIFPTPTKTDTLSEWGIEGLRTLRSRSRHMLIAIGGIHPANAAQVMEAGADGIAVVSAICAAADPEEVSRQLRRIVERTVSDSPGDR
ncbi:MAG: thiamine phosphate synthase [Candidatus Aminicenantales bacterium]